MATKMTMPPLPTALAAAPSLSVRKPAARGSPSTTLWVPGAGAEQVTMP